MPVTARTFAFETAVDVVECYKCGVPFWVSSSLKQHWRDTGDYFYCPAGHRQSYKTTTVQKLETKLADMENDRNWWRARRNNEMNCHRSTKGQMTKLKKRVGVGVCPCCQRTFKQLAAHMKRKHPEYSEKAS